MIMSVKHIDDYKKIMNYLFLETRYPGTDHTSPLQEDPEADSFIVQKFNRDLVYYNNMQKLLINNCVYKDCVLYNICSFYS